MHMSNEIPDVPDGWEPSDSVVAFSRTELGADEIYTLQKGADVVDNWELQARLEIERGNVLSYDDYQPRFTNGELLMIGIVMNEAKQIAYQAGDDMFVSAIQELGEIIQDHVPSPEPEDVPNDEVEEVIDSIEENHAVDVDLSDEAPPEIDPDDFDL